jgi:hypothetical protein
MKYARNTPVSLTEEDRRILQFVRWQLVNTIMDLKPPMWSYPEDRRDADILHALEGHKAVGAPRFLVRNGQLLGFTPGFLLVRVPEYDSAGELKNFA